MCLIHFYLIGMTNIQTLLHYKKPKASEIVQSKISKLIYTH